MFFPFLMSIKDKDVVLEIGPGAYPHWRSDCLVDKFGPDSNVDISQFGGAPQKTLGKPLFKMIDNIIPFKDKSFDYTICSHVLEHVNHDQLDLFLSEITRVTEKAYIELPRPIYDFIYDFDTHLNLMDIVDGVVICLPKTKTSLNKVKRFTKYALELRKLNNFSIELLNSSVIAIGQEFEGTIPLRIYDDEEEFFSALPTAPKLTKRPTVLWRCNDRIRRIKYHFSHNIGKTYFEGYLK